MGSVWGEGVKLDPACPRGGKIGNRDQAKADNMKKDEEEQPIRT
jgi:hypothetical protein